MTKSYTEEQQTWLKLFKARTGFDAMMEDFESGEKSFYEAARSNCRWWEDHSNDALLAITRDVPDSVGVPHES